MQVFVHESNHFVKKENMNVSRRVVPIIRF